MMVISHFESRAHIIRRGALELHRCESSRFTSMFGYRTHYRYNYRYHNAHSNYYTNLYNEFEWDLRYPTPRSIMEGSELPAIYYDSHRNSFH